MQVLPVVILLMIVFQMGVLLLSILKNRAIGISVKNDDDAKTDIYLCFEQMFLMVDHEAHYQVSGGEMVLSCLFCSK
jgi:hypothetical protein